MAWRGIALISSGWGPGCLSWAGIKLIDEVYAVETYGLDAHTQELLGSVHAFCTHTDAPLTADNQALLDSMARALRRAQSDERAAFVIPSGPVCDAVWPLMIQATRELGLEVRVAHGLGVIESLINVMQLPVPHSIDARPQLSDFVQAVRPSMVMVAPVLGDRHLLHRFRDTDIHCFAVDLCTKQVFPLDLDTEVSVSPRHVVVATQGQIDVQATRGATVDVNDALGHTGDWLELLNGFAEVQL